MQWEQPNFKGLYGKLASIYLSENTKENIVPTMQDLLS